MKASPPLICLKVKEKTKIHISCPEHIYPTDSVHFQLCLHYLSFSLRFRMKILARCLGWVRILKVRERMFCTSFTHLSRSPSLGYTLQIWGSPAAGLKHLWKRTETFQSGPLCFKEDWLFHLQSFIGDSVAPFWDFHVFKCKQANPEAESSKETQHWTELFHWQKIGYWLSHGLRSDDWMWSKVASEPSAVGWYWDQLVCQDWLSLILWPNWNNCSSSKCHRSKGSL